MKLYMEENADPGYIGMKSERARCLNVGDKRPGFSDQRKDENGTKLALREN